MGEPVAPEDEAAAEDNVVVERSGPEEVDPAGQPNAGEGALADSVPSGDAGEQAPDETLVPADEPTQAQQPIGATANETPTLPAGAQTAAAKAHATLEHLVTVAKAAQAEIGRYVPPDLLAAAERDVKQFVRSIL